MSNNLKDCRIYVCHPRFGSLEDNCIFFDTYEQYHSYLQNPKNMLDNSSFQPICNSPCWKHFDKFILAMRNNKTQLPKIANADVQ